MLRYAVFMFFNITKVAEYYRDGLYGEQMCMCVHCKTRNTWREQTANSAQLLLLALAYHGKKFPYKFCYPDCDQITTKIEWFVAMETYHP